MKIPFNKPQIVGFEEKYMSNAIREGHISGNGKYTKLSEKYIEEFLGSKSLLTTSGTHALEMSAKLLNLNSKDEVIVPSFSFVSTANAFAQTGARPVFCDIKLQDMNIDIKVAEKLITKKTKAICIVHYGGVGASLTEFRNLCDTYGLALIEDNAHGFGGLYRNKKLGTIGDFSILSFHETKNITCGEGGAIVVKNNSNLARAKVLRDKGTNRDNFLSGMVDKYTWVDDGSSWVMSELLSAFLYAQLEEYQNIDQKRKYIWMNYHESLSDWATRLGVDTLNYPDYIQHTSHLYFLRFSTKIKRDNFINYMKDNQIQTPFHYQALHEAPFAKKYHPSKCINSSLASETLVRLPIYLSMTNYEQEYIINKILDFNEKNN